jgi:hypothetical protein
MKRTVLPKPSCYAAKIWGRRPFLVFSGIGLLTLHTKPGFTICPSALAPDASVKRSLKALHSLAYFAFFMM